MTKQESVVTLAEVARVSGVSSATASRAINGRPGVSTKVRERVLAVAEALSYQANSAARKLAGGRSGTIGLALPTDGLEHGSYGSLLVQGVSEALERRDLTMMLWTTGGGREQSILEMANHHQLDGMLIVYPTMTESWAADLLSGPRPTVLLDSVGLTSPAYEVSSGNYAGARAAVTHLIEGGRSRIAHIAGPVTRSHARERKSGYIDTCRENDISTNGLVAGGEYTRRDGYYAMQELLPLNPDAVFASCDAMALGAIEVIEEAGLSVPDDIAVVGFNNSLEAHTHQAQLSSVELNRPAIAEAMVSLLEKAIDYPAMDPQTIEVVNTLIVRDSSRPRTLK